MWMTHVVAYPLIVAVAAAARLWRWHGQVGFDALDPEADVDELRFAHQLETRCGAHEPGGAEGEAAEPPEALRHALVPE